MKNIIGYYTDNPVSKEVMSAFSSAAYEVRHIEDIDPYQPAIFYGILRGAGLWQHTFSELGMDWWYVDNGYYGAQYIDRLGHKSMAGTYRVVKNARIEQYEGNPQKGDKPKSLLVIPPSEASAFMLGTTPEDWVHSQKFDIKYTVRTKSDTSPLDEQVMAHDAVYACNSMAVLRAVELGRPVYTTDGIFPFTDMDNTYYYDHNALVAYYTDKQFTLSQISKGKACLN